MRKILSLGIAAFVLLALPATAADWQAGVDALQSGNYGEAIKQFKELVDLQDDQYQNHMMLGQALLKNGQAGEAAASLKRALELKPGDAGITVALGQSLSKSGKYRDCVNLFNNANVGSFPANLQGPAHQIKAGCSQKGGGDATADLRALAQAKPNDATAQYAYGTAALASNQTDAAIAALSKAVQLDPQPKYRKAYVDALKLKARRAQGSAKTSAYQTAVQQAQALVSASGTHGNLLTLGEVQMGAKMYDPAISTFKKAQAAQSSDWFAPYYLGQAYAASGRYTEAEAPLQTALRLASGNNRAKVNSQLGFVYAKQKRYDEAVAAYNAAGEPGKAAGVLENKNIAAENAEADAHNEKVRQLQEQRDKLRDQLDNPVVEPPF